jgi:hypothetical protein
LSVIFESWQSLTKLKDYSKNQPCYYCGAPGPSGREHAPPKMMFTHFDCDCITVPSCDKHNTKKSIGDRAIITAIIMGASQTFNHRDKLSVPLDRLTPNVLAAIKLVEPNFHQAKNEVELRDFLINPPDGLDIPIPYTQLGIIIPGWIRQLTAALVWSLIGRHEPNIAWDEVRVWSPGLVMTSEPITSENAVSLLSKHHDLEQYFNKMPWRLGWSAYPKKYPADIYSFDLCFPEDIENWQGMNVGFRHRFYNGISVWYVWLKAPQEIVNALVVAAADKNNNCSKCAS